MALPQTSNITLNKLFIIISLVVAVVLLSALVFAYRGNIFNWLDQTPEAAPTTSHYMGEYETSQRMLAQMDFDGAIAFYDELIAKSTDPNVVASLEIRKAYAMFSKSESESTRAATNRLADIAEDETKPSLYRGWALLGLLQFYYQSQHPDVLAVLRSLAVISPSGGEELSDNELLRATAEVSDKLAPSIMGKLFMAAPLAVEMFQAETSDDDKARIAREIEILIDQSLVTQTEAGWFDTPHDLMLADHYRGLLLSAAAEGGASPDLANFYFVRAIETSANESSPATDQLSLYTRFYQAAHLLNYGSDELTDQRIKELLLAVEQIPSVHPFILFAERAKANPTSRNYTLFAALAARDDEFKNFWSQRYQLDF